MRRLARYIHELPEWPQFGWDRDHLANTLAAVRHQQGRLIGRMEALGFPLQQEATLAALTEETVKSSDIEGEKLEADQVRSSIARRLGLDVAGVDVVDRRVESIVEMVLDATRNYPAFLTISATTMDLAAPGVWMLVACRCGDGRRQWCGVGIVWLDTARLAKLLRPGSDRLPAGGRCASGGRPRPAQAVGGDDEQVGVRQVVGQRDPDTACGDTDMGADLEQPEA